VQHSALHGSYKWIRWGDEQIAAVTAGNGENLRNPTAPSFGAVLACEASESFF
jgi:hypothetical protein